MNNYYEITLSNSTLFNNELLMQLLSSLESLELISNNIFLNLNNSIIERKNKIENLHSRIVRISLILNMLESIPQALTLLSKKFYPCNVNSYITSSLYESKNLNLINNTNLNSYIKPYFTVENTLENKINNVVSNSYDVLGKQPNSDVDDIKLNQDILNSIVHFKDLRQELISSNLTNLNEINNIDSTIEMFTSLLNFSDKTKLIGNYIDYSTKILQTNSQMLNNDFISNVSNRTTLNKNKLQNKYKIKKPFNAPNSLLNNNNTIKTFNRSKETIKQKNRINIDSLVDSKLKKNVGLLSNIVDLNNGDNFTNDKETNNYSFGNIENTDNFNNEDMLEDVSNDASYYLNQDDVYNYILPIDRVKLNNTKNASLYNTGDIKIDNIAEENKNKNISEVVTSNSYNANNTINSENSNLIKPIDVISSSTINNNNITKQNIKINENTSYKNNNCNKLNEYNTVQLNSNVSIVENKAANVPKPPVLPIPVISKTNYKKKETNTTNNNDSSKINIDKKKEEVVKLPSKSPVSIVLYNI